MSLQMNSNVMKMWAVSRYNDPTTIFHPNQRWNSKSWRMKRRDLTGKRKTLRSHRTGIRV